MSYGVPKSRVEVQEDTGGETGHYIHERSCRHRRVRILKPLTVLRCIQKKKVRSTKGK